MSGDKHGVPNGIIIAVLIVTLIAFYIFSSQFSSKARKIGPRVKTDKASANNDGAANETKPLPIDIPGSHDFKDIGRPPRSSIIWRQHAKLMGLGSKTVKYMTLSSPEELQRYFTDKLADKYAIIRDDLATDNGMGWSGLFLNPETDELVAVFSTVKHLDLPPGGADNPSMVSIMKVKNIAKNK